MKELLNMANELVRELNHPLPTYIKVLVCDDDPNEIELLEAILKLPGVVSYQVERVNTYDEALALMPKNQHDVYIIDYKLDQKNGIELIHEATDLGAVGPFVIWSGFVEEKELEKALTHLHVTGFMPKVMLTLGGDAAYTYLIVDNILRYAVKNYRMNKSVAQFAEALQKKRIEFDNMLKSDGE